MTERYEDNFTPIVAHDKTTQEIESDIFLFWKNVSETTFQAIQRFKVENPEHADSKMCFAGRLDPMAQGWLILLLNDAVHLKEDFIQKEKVYTASVLIGIQTDTDDVFGLIEKNILNEIDSSIHTNIREKVLNTGKKYEKKFMQKFSPFSSKHVEGKALFWWATEKRLHEIKIPTHEVEVVDFQVSPCIHLCEKKTWLNNMNERFQNIEGDFRNTKIIEQWGSTIDHCLGDNLTHFTVRIHASTGMYVRQLVRDIGEEIGVPLCVVEITRQEIMV